MARCVQICCGIVATGLASLATADVTFLTQQRSITAATTADGNAQTASAPDFAPFVHTLNVSTTFPGPGGPVTNAAVSRIDCQLDPNFILAAGSLTGAGGVLASTGGTEVGDAKAAIMITFQVNSAVTFNLLATPRPDLHPTDEFVLEFRDLTHNVHIVSLDETALPQQIDMSGTLQPGQYSLRYRIEATFDDAESNRNYSLNLSLGCRADFNGEDGVTVQDIFDFLNAWFAADPRTDFNGMDGITVQDILDFLNAWFAGCV